MVYNEKAECFTEATLYPYGEMYARIQRGQGAIGKESCQMTKKMTRKRFCKLLMAHGVNRNTARGLVQCVNAALRYDFIEGFTVKFVNGQKYQVDNVHSYREAYESTQKDGVPLV